MPAILPPPKGIHFDTSQKIITRLPISAQISVRSILEGFATGPVDGHRKRMEMVQAWDNSGLTTTPAGDTR